MRTKPKTDRLATVLEKVPTKKLRASLTKTKAIAIRVTEDDHEGMRLTAKACGMSVTEYITRLHAFASERLAGKEE
jgi:predicted DNA binding CopG/RHH family protein